MKHWLLVALLAVSACHHDAAPPATPAEQPPLPPASGTPIGYLLDEGTSLNLTDDQRTKLTEIDRGLADQLAELDTQSHVAKAPDAGGQQQPMGRRGGRRGGMGGGGGGRRSRGGGGTAGSGSPVNYAPSTAQTTESRADDVRDAITRALALLDDTQRAAATKLLDSHGVDVDAGRPTASSAAPPPVHGEDGGEP
jgi:hypothetical protein